MYSDNLAYAKQRLEGTLVRVGEEPFYITRVTTTENVDIEDDDDDEEDHQGDIVCEGVLIKDNSKSIVKVDSLNLCPVPLGYVNLNEDVIYFVRKPMRNDWRQGLRENNSASVGAEYYGLPDYKHLRQTILNIYPSVKTCQEYLKLGYRSVAFSRDFAISAKNLFYRGRICGEGLELYPKYNYLKEYLNEVIDANR